jgi:hypothetical protein
LPIVNNELNFFDVNIYLNIYLCLINSIISELSGNLPVAFLEKRRRPSSKTSKAPPPEGFSSGRGNPFFSRASARPAARGS